MTTTTETPVPAVPKAPLSRTLRNISVSLGVANFQATLHSAVLGDDDDSLNNVCTGSEADPHPPAAAKQTLACPICKADENFHKARAVGTSFVVVPPAVLAEAEATTKQYNAALTLNVHPAEGLDVRAAGKVYYLGAKGTAGVYATFAALLRNRPDLALIGKMTYQNGSDAKVYRLGVEGDLLVMHQLAYPEAVREAPVVLGVADEADLAMLTRFAELKSQPFDPTMYANTKSAVIVKFVEDAPPIAAAVVAEDGTTTAVSGSLTDVLAAEVARIAPAKKPATRRAAKPTKLPAATAKPAKVAPIRKSA